MILSFSNEEEFLESDDESLSFSNEEEFFSSLEEGESKDEDEPEKEKSCMDIIVYFFKYHF